MAQGPGKGRTNNPNGRPKGAKDKKARVVKERVLDVWDKLEKTEGKGLLDSAKNNPEWFYTNFVKTMLPKEVDAQVDVGDNFTEILRKIIK